MANGPGGGLRGAPSFSRQGVFERGGVQFFSPGRFGGGVQRPSAFAPGERGEVGGVQGTFVSTADISSADLIGASPEQQEAIRAALRTGVPQLQQAAIAGGPGMGLRGGPFAGQRQAARAAQQAATFFLPDFAQPQQTAAVDPGMPEELMAPGDPGALQAAAARQDAAAAALAAGETTQPLVAGRREALMARRGMGIGLAPLGRGFTAANLLATTPV